MTSDLLAALATAGVLGVTHAVEPDHVAGISSLTGRAGDARLSALVGACFSLGHVALVVAWLALGYVVLGRTEFPPAFDAVGTVGVAVLLGLLGATMAVGGVRSAVRAHAHTHTHAPTDDHTHTHTDDAPPHTHTDDAHDGTTHAHPHVHLPLVGGHDHDHTVATSLKTGVVGALFTLSPPLSMLAFAAGLFPRYGPATVGLAVVVYAVAITAVMSSLGAGVGATLGVVGDRPRLHGAARATAGVLVVGVAAWLLVSV